MSDQIQDVFEHPFHLFFIPANIASDDQPFLDAEKGFGGSAHVHFTKTVGADSPSEDGPDHIHRGLVDGRIRIVGGKHGENIRIGRQHLTQFRIDCF